MAAFAMQEIMAGRGEEKKLTAKLAKKFPELKNK
jgi:hypothetical protein